VIGGLPAAKLLQAALKSTKPPVFPVVARACLQCAEGLMAGNRARALELYTELSATSMPGPVRLTALRVLNAARRRPRERRSGRRRRARQPKPTRAGFWGAAARTDGPTGREACPTLYYNTLARASVPQENADD